MQNPLRLIPDPPPRTVFITVPEHPLFKSDPSRLRPAWQTRVVVYASAVCIFTLVVGGAWVPYRAQGIESRARAQRTGLLSAFTTATAHGLAGWLRVAVDELNDAAATPSLRSAVKGLAANGGPRTSAVEQISESFEDDFRRLTDTACELRTPDGRTLVATAGDNQKLAWLTADRIGASDREGAAFIGPATADGTPTLALVAPVGEPDAPPEALLILALESDEVLSGLPALKLIGKSARATLFDAYGHTSGDDPTRWRLRAGRDGSVASGELNAQGTRVMTAWAWRSHAGLGLALEVDEAELLAGMARTVFAMRVLGVMLWVLAAAFTLCIVRLLAVTRRQQKLAQTDALTGLANRRRFDETLAHEVSLARRSGKPLSLLMIDVDHFKAFNDTAGHPAGDACLKKVARHVRRAFKRAADLPARYGGEEFAVILPMTDSIGARLRAERIRSNLIKAQIKHPASPTSPRVTVSIGVATVRVNSDAQTPDTLVDLADLNLYAAKENGRDRVEGGEAAEQTAAPRKLEMAA